MTEELLAKKVRTAEENLAVFKAITDGLFRKLFALTIVLFGGNFLFDVAMKVKGETRMMIVGAVITLVTSIFTFYFGTSQSSQDKDKKINAITEGG